MDFNIHISKQEWMPSANKLLTYSFRLWRKHDVTLFVSRKRACLSCTWHNWTAVMHHSRFHSVRRMATKLTRHKSGGLCHLVCHSAMYVWDQSSWHWWAATVSTACVVETDRQTCRCKNPNMRHTSRLLGKKLLSRTLFARSAYFMLINKKNNK